MADNIINGLFGIDPAMLQQQQQTAASQRAFNYANLSAPEQGQYGAYVGGSMLGQAAQGLMGVQDPMMQKATMAKQLASQFDITTASGLRQYAQALAQNGAPDLAQLAAAEADKREQTGLGLQKTRADIAVSERKVSQDEKLREELMKLGDNPTEEQYLKVFRQFGSPDQQAKAIEASIARKQKAAGGDGSGVSGKPGAVGKAGAWRDSYGDIIPPAVMKDVHKEFKAAQNLYDTLSQVSAADVKNAESFVDWTTKSSEVKGLASTDTLKAQTKLAASQLMEQIGQLPPGSASDADMRASMKSFPGYSNPEALAQWVNETKRKLERTINIGVEQYGFKANVKPSAPLDLTKKAASGKAGSSRENPIKLD
jgi:hypothetical protein